ncbi:Uncharacterised protein [Bordetella pertussis]|nr:Uncharacterised protein [Bordetella pertussis]
MLSAAVRISTGSTELRARSLRSTSSPGRWGRPRSRISRSKGWTASAESAASPSRTASTA